MKKRNHSILWDFLPFLPKAEQRTKYQILIERRNWLYAEHQRLARELDSLRETRCGLVCGGCGAEHRTEADFAAHYIIPDERYLNLGSCPVKDK